MQYIIRPVRFEDADGINQLRRMPGVFENILGKPSERLVQSEAFIASMDQFEHSMVAVSTDTPGQETVLGVCGLSVLRNPRCRHVGSLGMMVHKDYQGQGIGAALLQSVLDLADNWLMLLRVELEVFADNSRAIGLYERFGFEREGLRRMGAARNGVYVDEVYMARLKPDGNDENR